MKKIYMLMCMALLVIASIAAVSAKTVVAGKIYDSPNFESANPVANANINITCNSYLMQTLSLSDGTYSVSFDTNNCPEASTVTVVAEKDGIINSGTGIVHDYTAIVEDLFIGVVNIALIPEFGLYVGAMTLVSAIALFFMVRRK